MPHRFVIIVDGDLRVYERYEDIPETIDRVIEFLPEYPPGPHTDEEHEEIERWSDRLDRLMERERASGSEKR